MKEIKARLATPDDARAFVGWAVNNPDIPSEDINAVAKASPLTIVVEIDGQPELYTPLIPAMTIGYLGFRPDQDVRTKALALKEMKKALDRLLEGMAISYAYVHTREEYPMGKWAVKNGFQETAKPAFVLERR